MSRSRRYIYDRLQDSREPRWLTIRSASGALLEYHRIEPGADLTRAFLAAILEKHDAGWRVADFSASGSSARLERGMERRMLGIEQYDPEEPSRIGRGPSWPGQCSHCED